MKKILYILFIIPLIALGQAPQGVNYQAVAYDANGFELSNKEVGVRISIVEGSAFGSPKLVEEHDVITTEQGLFSIVIGQGALLGGEVASLLDIPWGSNTYFLKIELDTENNGSYMDFGTQQFMSVPYALYAESTGDKNDADANPENELQVISINEDTIFLSAGGYVTLPETFSGHYDSLIGSPHNVSQFINDVGYLTQGNQFGGILPSWIYDTGLCSNNIPASLRSSDNFSSNGNFSLCGVNSYCNFILNEGDTLNICDHLVLKVSDTLILNGVIDGIGKGGSLSGNGGAAGGNGGQAHNNCGSHNNISYESSNSVVNNYTLASNGGEISESDYFMLINYQATLTGGKGGSGAFQSWHNNTNTNSGGNGGAGVVIISNNFEFNGEINLSGSNGDNGSSGGSESSGGAGGGGGGSIIINVNSITSNTGNIITSGGNGGNGATHISTNHLPSCSYSSPGNTGGNGFVLWLSEQ